MFDWLNADYLCELFCVRMRYYWNFYEFCCLIKIYIQIQVDSNMNFDSKYREFRASDPRNYYQDNKAKKTTNCLGTLNQILPQTEGFAIDEKKANYYEKIAKHFKKRDTVVKCSAKNESFKHFLDQLSIILSPPSH